MKQHTPDTPITKSSKKTNTVSFCDNCGKQYKCKVLMCTNCFKGKIVEIN